MECDEFFALVEQRLSERYLEPTTTETGGQCVVEFFHPRVVERFGSDGLVTRFNRSGLVWAPPVDRLGAKLRVTDAVDGAVADALGRAPFPLERRDNRVVGAPDGEMVTILHFSTRTGPVSRADLETTLEAIADALSV